MEKHEKNKKNRKLLIIILSIVSALVISAIVLIVVLLGKNKNEKTSLKEPTVTLEVVSNTYYAGMTLEDVEVNVNSSTDGVWVWVNKTQELEEGTHGYAWKFVPTSGEFKEVSGNLNVTAIADTLQNFGLENAPTKLSGYHAFETIDLTGAKFVATYSSGRTQTVLANYEIVYENGTSFVAHDTKLTITYHGMNVVINLTSEVLPAEVTPREFAYSWTGEAQSANGSETLYTYSSASYTDAGRYANAVTLVLKDKVNYVWAGTGNANDITVDFIIGYSASEKFIGTFTYTNTAFVEGEWNPDRIDATLTLNADSTYEITVHYYDENNGTPYQKELVQNGTYSISGNTFYFAVNSTLEFTATFDETAKTMTSSHLPDNGTNAFNETEIGEVTILTKI